MLEPKDVRTKLNLTQEQMAAACNTGVSTVRKWEAKEGYNNRKPRGQAERLLELLIDLQEKNLFDWYRSKYGF